MEKSLRVRVPERMQDALNVETAKRKTTVSEIIRAFLRAWLKKDPRADAIVTDYSNE